MTYELVLAMVEALGDDASVYETTRDGLDMVDVTLEDFGGFTEDYEELDREYDDAQAVEDFLGALEDTCLMVSGDYYHYYHFEDFVVCVGYASMDI